MRLASMYYVCVCCEIASVRMLSVVLVGCLVQSRGVFAIGQSIESQGTFCGTFLCCVACRGLRCDIGEFGSRRDGSTCPKAFCMRSSSVSKGTACSSCCHKHQRQCWIGVGGEEYSLNLSHSVQVADSA